MLDKAGILGTSAASALTAAIGPLSQHFSDLMPSRDALRSTAINALLGYDPRQVDYSAFTKHLEAVRNTAIEALRDAMPRLDVPTGPFSAAAIFQKAQDDLYASLQRKIETMGIGTPDAEGERNVRVEIHENKGQTPIEDVIESISYQSDYHTLLSNHELLRDEIESLKTRLDSPKALQAFMNIINLVAFALALIGWYNDFFGVSNSTVLATINTRFDGLENKINHSPQFASAAEKLIGLPRLELRTARTSTMLLVNDRKGAAVKKRILKGQLVMTLDSIHKHLFVAYIDMNTGEHQTGYVLKKYFKRVVR